MEKKIDELKEKARWVRCQVLEMISNAKKGHIGGAFSSTDVLVALYYGGILKYKPKNPKWSNRDYFIISKGHSGVALYAILADLGYFSTEELEKFCDGGILGGHPDRNIPGIEADTGSLGHGLGIAAGIALAAKMDKKQIKSIVLLGDGECYEGSVWESAQFAAHHKLNNLIAIVDRNMQGVTDFTEDANKLEPLDEKWKAFGWNVKKIDGHSFKEILRVFTELEKDKSDKPCVIIAKTVKGKGVDFMECKLAWHHSVPKNEKLTNARNQLNDNREVQ